MASKARASRGAGDGQDEEYQRTLAGLTAYAKDKVEVVLKQMLNELFIATPEDPVQYMIDWLVAYQKKNPSDRDAATESAAAAPEQRAPDHLRTLSVEQPANAGPNFNRGRRRVAVSAEPVADVDDDSTPTPVITKTDEEAQQIRNAVQDNILFTSLDEDQMKIVVNAMQKKVFGPGETIIQQGEPGDHYYVLSKGECDCYVTPKGKPDAKPILVKQYAYGESFGELALMYNCPRAATIKARTPTEVWAMDRVTFRKVLMNTTREKRTKYESFLQKVPLLSHLDKYERSKIADALIDVTFQDGACIIAAGDRGNNIYFIREGEAVATKILPGMTEPQQVMRYGPGAYFGELALLTDAPRQANVYAVGPVKCVYLDRASFNRLLGPCEEIMKRNVTTYRQAETRVQEEALKRERSRSQMSLPGAAQLSVDGGDAGNGATPAPAGHGSTIPDTGSGGAERSVPASPASDIGGGVDSVEKERQITQRGRGRRKGVSAEPVSDTGGGDWQKTVIPKTADQAQAIRQSVRRNILFQSLESDQMQIVVDAMFEKLYQPGDTIIKQGDDGDAFYVLHRGVAECFVQKGDSPPMLVKVYQAGESFGELALMYNCPRAATIKAKTECAVWGMDRVTFHHLLFETTQRKRKAYEGFLVNVPLLSSLDNYERAKVADALESVDFEDGEYIIRQGEEGHSFFILEQGEAVARKKLHFGDTEEQEVYRYHVGGFFGELALLHDMPRQANVVAVGKCRVAKLDRDSFVRLLGPCEEILKRNKDNYSAIEARLKDALGSRINLETESEQ